MASSMNTLFLLVLALALFSCPQIALGQKINCEDLEKDECGLAVSSTGQRCVLEKGVKRSGEESFRCRASFVYASESLKNWVESTHCVQACGINRYPLGISSDLLMHKSFTRLLCSPPCMDACPNVIDLYSNLAAAKGASLLHFCAAQKSGLRRGLGEFLSSSMAEVPTTSTGMLSANLAGLDAPAPSPATE